MACLQSTNSQSSNHAINYKVFFPCLNGYIATEYIGASTNPINLVSIIYFCITIMIMIVVIYIGIIVL